MNSNKPFRVGGQTTSLSTVPVPPKTDVQVVTVFETDIPWFCERLGLPMHITFKFKSTFSGTATADQKLHTWDKYHVARPTSSSSETSSFGIEEWNTDSDSLKFRGPNAQAQARVVKFSRSPGRGSVFTTVRGIVEI
ncbi:hypothetical protein AX16_007170 [Volvariella volvacea WC 439]|nr:hypothetical protein AX16_007170 [Volvariella volvacea WC 439]